MQIKGKAEIIIRDALTGEIKPEKCRVEENMLTGAIANLLNPNFIADNLSRNFDNNLTYLSKLKCNPLTMYTPIVSELLGGILVFNKPLMEEVTNILPNKDIMSSCIGYAGDEDYTGVNSYRGRINAGSTGFVDETKKVYKYTFDFDTQKSNGVIASVALTSRLGGQCGLRNDNKDFGNLDIPLRQDIEPALSTYGVGSLSDPQEAKILHRINTFIPYLSVQDGYFLTSTALDNFYTIRRLDNGNYYSIKKFVFNSNITIFDDIKENIDDYYNVENCPLFKEVEKFTINNGFNVTGVGNYNIPNFICPPSDEVIINGNIMTMIETNITSTVGNATIVYKIVNFDIVLKTYTMKTITITPTNFPVPIGSYKETFNQSIYSIIIGDKLYMTYQNASPEVMYNETTQTDNHDTDLNIIVVDINTSQYTNIKANLLGALPFKPMVFLDTLAIFPDLDVDGTGNNNHFYLLMNDNKFTMHKYNLDTGVKHFDKDDKLIFQEDTPEPIVPLESEIADFKRNHVFYRLLNLPLLFKNPLMVTSTCVGDDLYSSKHFVNLSVFSPYLSTINNIQEPINKESTETMQIIYQLTLIEEPTQPTQP